MGEIDSEMWLGKNEAAKLLKTSPRQLERRAREGRVGKRYLPRKPSEKAARVVYSRNDILDLVNGRVALDPSELALSWMPKKEAAEFLGVSLNQLTVRVREGYIEKRSEKTGPVFSVADMVALKSGKPIRVNSASSPSPQPQVEAMAQAIVAHSPDPFAGLAAHLAKLAAAYPSPAPELKPWLTLDEAARYSGLPARFLVDRARSGGLRAVNVGPGSREFWRFHREGLTK